MAGAQLDVGLDRWPRFVADARKYADQPWAARGTARSGIGAVLTQLGKLNPIGTARAQPPEGEEENRRFIEELTDPLAPLRIAACNVAVSRIRQLNPRYAVLSRPDSTPSQEAVNNAQGTLLATRRQIAEDMAAGHGPEKHTWEPGATNREEYRDIVESVLSHPHAQVIPLRRERTAFYDESRNILVIVDPNSRDKGTAFQPDDGPLILKRLRRESR